MGLLPLVNNIMKFDVVDIKGKKVGDLTVDKDVFGINPNEAVVRQAILSELNNMRQGTHSTKNRALVNGGGKKPWKQKGRGVARAGTIRSPDPHPQLCWGGRSGQCAPFTRRAPDMF